MPVLPSYRNHQLICRANQLTGFYIRATPALNGLKGLWRVSKSKALKEIERGQGFIDTSRKYAGARYTISHWNHNVTTRNAVETLMNFSLSPGSEKMQSSIVEISKLIESELLVNLTQALMTVFFAKTKI